MSTHLASRFQSAYSHPHLHSRGIRSLDDSDSDHPSPSGARSGSVDTDETRSNASHANYSGEEEEEEQADCKYDDEELLKTRTPLLTGDDVHAKREEIREYFHKTFSLYEKLFSVLASEETYYMQPEKLRHPLIFYWAHTAVFFINKLRLAGVLHQRINETLESTCAIGVDEMSWDDLNTGNYQWPSVEQATKYRDMCRVVVDDLISSLPLQLPITWESPFWVILMGCEHERIHLETSSVLFRQLPIDQVKAVPMWSHCREFRARPDEVPRNQLLCVPAGVVLAGKDQATQEMYGWDNEYGTFRADVAEFQAARFLCSNAEFYEFVCDGGYEDETLWGEEGWKFVQFRNARHPVFWVPQPEQQLPQPPAEQLPSGKVDLTSPTASLRPVYQYRTMTAVIPMPWDWPVDVNYIEAKAYCAWLNRRRERAGQAVPGKVVRLATEAEYLRLREHAFPERAVDPATGAVTRNDQPFWQAAPGNINLEHGASSCPIDKFAFGHGFYDVIGNVWQWSETPIMPLRGFKYHPLYDDFSVPTFDTRHNIFTGGSWASTGNEATRSARYAFRRHFYQHAGFRYVLADPLPEVSADAPQAMCETDPDVTFMMDVQYNDTALEKIQRRMGMAQQPNFAVRIAEIAVQAYQQHGRSTRSVAASSSSPSASSDASASPTSTPSSLASAGPRAVDVGCACGRSTFELAKLSASRGGLFDHVLGLDFSTRFIRLAAQLQFQVHAEYAVKREGELIDYHSIECVPVGGVIPKTSDEATIRLDLDLKSRGLLEKVEFMQADACNLPTKYAGFDLVLAANLLEYLYDPAHFLRQLAPRVRQGGILLVASAFAWDTAYTPREKWLGGLKDATGESVDAARAVAELLESLGFEQVRETVQEIPMIWKCNARQAQIRIAHVAAWRKL